MERCVELKFRRKGGDSMFTRVASQRLYNAVRTVRFLSDGVILVVHPYFDLDLAREIMSISVEDSSEFRRFDDFSNLSVQKLCSNLVFVPYPWGFVDETGNDVRVAEIYVLINPANKMSIVRTVKR